MWELKDIIVNIRIFDIIDIAIVAYVFYNIYMLIKQTRAEQLIKGIFILLFATKISEVLQLQVVNWFLRNTMTVGLIALMIVFQPELRRILEHLGRTKFLVKNTDEPDTKIEILVNELMGASKSLSESKTGALIILERRTGINDIIQTGTSMDALVSRQLLTNLFVPNTPLHDGAVVIRGDRILAAGCFLPLTENKLLDQELGTRHRAAIGISERSDCISLIVSEETGGISLAKNGKILKNLTIESLRRLLMDSLNEKDEKSLLQKVGAK
ncbi:MAG: diadenylate cyclase CdaA [Filifactoraceae bacterium]